MNGTMFRSSILGCMLLLCVSAWAAPISVEQLKKQAPAPERATAAPGIIIVMLKADAVYNNSGASLGVAGLDDVLRRINANSIRSFHNSAALNKGDGNSPAARLSRMFKIQFGSPEDSYALCAELSNNPAVEFAEPYYWFKFDYTPNDPRLGNQWYINVMNLKEAWEVTKGSPDVVIGIVDSGVEWDHPDLEANIYRNPGEWGTSGELSNNGIDDDNNGFIDDYHGWDLGDDDNDPMDNGVIAGGSTTYHGTMTAGCASAVADNGVGIAGAGFSCKILPVKAAPDMGATGITHGYEGIKYACDAGAKVISCSWGSVGAESQAIRTIMDYVFSRGSLVVGSAGNDPIDNDYYAHYPSSFRSVLNVGSVEPNGAFSTWCTYGATVDVYSPGTNIFTTDHDGSYSSTQGTSFSCPLAAGVAALVFSVHPDWTPEMVAKQIRVTAYRPASSSAKRYGRIDAEAAVTKNATLSDIPGLEIENVTMPYPNNVMFNALGQTSSFTVRLKNLLAPTSASASATLEFDQGFIYPQGGAQTIGVVPHNGTIDLTFSVKYADTSYYSEGTIPFRIRIEDGELVDYLPVSGDIYVSNGWHFSDNNYRPIYNSICAVDKDVTWAISRIEQMGNAEDAWVTTDGGQTWIDAHTSETQGWPSQNTGIYCIHGVDDNTALFGLSTTTRGMIYKTSNRGGIWKGVLVSSITRFVNFIHMFDMDNGMFQGDPYNDKWGIATTTDGGTTWTKLATQIAAPADEMGWNNAYSALGDTVWFGTNNFKIYKSVDRGQTWVSYPTPGKNSIGISFRDQNVGAIRYSRQSDTSTLAGDIDGLGITTDGGMTWTTLSTIDVSSGGQMQMERHGQRLWVMTGGLCYVSTDLGATWTMVATPPSFGVTCSDSYVDEENSQTYVWAGGAYLFNYKTPFLRTVGVGPQAGSIDGFAITSVYPNPANLSLRGVSVEFTLPEQGETEMQIFDYVGRHVGTAFSATLAPGNHSAFIDLGNLPAGNYFLRLHHGNAVQVKQVTLMR